MIETKKMFQDAGFLRAALEGLELRLGRINEQIGRVRAVLGPPRRPARGPLSAEARRRIALAQMRRWAEYRKQRAVKGAAKKKKV